jgi:hypothetical protein
MHKVSNTFMALIPMLLLFVHQTGLGLSKEELDVPKRCAAVLSDPRWLRSLGEPDKLTQRELVQMALQSVQNKNTWKEPWQHESARHPWTKANIGLNVNDSCVLIQANKALILAQTLPDFAYYTRNNKTKLVQLNCMSVVSKDFLGARELSGFLVQSPPENIVATSYKDLGSSGQSPEYWRTQLGVMSPEELVQRSGWWVGRDGDLERYLHHNEVLVASEYIRPEGEILRPTVYGVYVIKGGRTPVSEDQIAAAKSLADKMHLQYVEFNNEFPGEVIIEFGAWSKIEGSK